MSPPLVVAFALAGRVDIDLDKDALGYGKDGKPVYLRDLWPSLEEIQKTVTSALKPEMFAKKYGTLKDANPEWNAIKVTGGERYAWNEKSTYIQLPPFFENFSLTPGKIAPLANLRPMAILGDSVTTDHISPAGSFKSDTPAGKFLIERGVKPADFNSYGSRRGNDRVMTRGTFANVRIKNAMAGGKEGGFTKLQPSGEILPIYDASQAYIKSGTGLIVFAGVDYGMGSSRDWAAKGTALLGVKAVVAKSFERIHRSNLLGMGVLPLEFTGGQSAESLRLDGTETFSLPGLGEGLKPKQMLDLVIRRANGTEDKVALQVRIDTLIEVEYYRHGGILPYVLRQLLKS
jgi:aconitate hydratase